jgi:hypothetical protein
MKKPALLGAALLASPIASVLPASINYAYANLDGGYGLYVSRPVQVRVLGMSRSIRVGIRVIENGNSGNDQPFCPRSKTPNSATVEILDADTLEVLEVSGRYVIDSPEGLVPMQLSMTGTCRSIRYGLDFHRSGKSLAIRFNWDANKGMQFRTVGEIDIRDGETFTKSSSR